jgi:hypothetical protein
MTLLEMTQNVLSAMSSDEVSVSLTLLSLSKLLMKFALPFEIIYSNHDLATFEGLINLESPGDTTTPNVLLLPETIQSVKWIKYRDTTNTDDNTDFKDLIYLCPEDFIHLIVEQPRPASSADIAILPLSPVTYPINNLKSPSYYTILDTEQVLVFDSFDSNSESFLTGSNSIAWGLFYKVFDLEDDFIPPLPANEFPRLLAEAKAFCFANIKEMNNPKEEQRAHRQKVLTQRRRAVVPGQQRGALTGVDYSRKR